MATNENYNPEDYWNKVAQQIASRVGTKLIAGDDEPYYRYKRKKFLKLLHTIPFTGKKVIEIGCGPGGNLKEIALKEPAELVGVDVSAAMLKVAAQTTQGTQIKLAKTDGESLPFDDRYFDISFTSTVLQHVTDEEMLGNLIASITRITKDSIYIFERIEKRRKEIPSNTGRTISEYTTLFGGHGFQLQQTKFLNVFWSYAAGGVIRKVFNHNKRIEGEAQPKIVSVLQNAALLFTKPLDSLLPIERDVAMLHFKRLE